VLLSTTLVVLGCIGRAPLFLLRKIGAFLSGPAHVNTVTATLVAVQDDCLQVNFFSLRYKRSNRAFL